MDTTENAGFDQAIDLVIDGSGETGDVPELEALHAESLDADDDEPEEEQPKPVKPPAIERRIAELTRMRYESDRRAEEAERVAQALRQRYEEPVQQSQQDGRPLIEWFDTLADYEHALEEYATRQVYQQVSHQFEEQRHAAAQAEVGQRFVQAESRFSKEIQTTSMW